MKTSFLDFIENNIIVGDGAMGTMIYARGIPTSHCFDELNLSRPALVQEILRAYVRAGAKAIETNTFTANKRKLARYELEQLHDEINGRGVELAKTVAGDEAFVLASIGPAKSGETDEVEDEELFEIFCDQVRALASAAPDALLLETFSRAGELEIAVQAAAETADLPLIAQASVDEEGYLRDGQHIVPTFNRLHELGADVVGVNCAKGPTGILHALEQVPIDDGKFLSAYPNAGLPAYIDGRYIYLSTPEYFADSALRLREQGARLIGGCCGTTPEHIRAIRNAVDSMRQQ